MPSLARETVGFRRELVCLLTRLERGFLAQRFRIAFGLAYQVLGIVFGLAEEALDAGPRFFKRLFSRPAACGSGPRREVQRYRDDDQSHDDQDADDSVGS